MKCYKVTYTQENRDSYFALWETRSDDMERCVYDGDPDESYELFVYDWHESPIYTISFMSDANNTEVVVEEISKKEMDRLHFLEKI